MGGNRHYQGSSYDKKWKWARSRWEELRWTGQKASKNQAILSDRECRDASHHWRAGSARRNLKAFLTPRVTGQLSMQWE